MFNKSVSSIHCQNKIQHKPYLLPKGLQWAKLDIEKVANTYQNIFTPLKWMSFHPLALSTKASSTSLSSDNHWSFLVLNNYQVAGAMLSHPLCIQLGNNLLKFVCFWSMTKYSRIVVTLFKESSRRVNLSNFNQGILYLGSDSIFKPFVILTQYEFKFSYSQLPSAPKTPGWRAMTSKHIPSALALTNKYTPQFEIRQVFQSEEEFSYYFMCPMIENYMQAYVVVDPVTDDITDVAGFKLERGMNGRNLFAYITILVPMKSSLARQLLIDLLVCAKQAKVDILYTFKFGLATEVFEDLLNIKSTNCYWPFINYQYDEVDESQFCLFCY